MQMNKNLLIIGGLLVAMILGTVLLVRHKKPAGGPAKSAPSAGLEKPRALALAKGGELLIVDSRNHRLEVRRPGVNGQTLKRVGELGNGKLQFREPCGLAVDSAGNIYVADTFHPLREGKDGDFPPYGRVVKLSPDYRQLSSIDKMTATPAEFFGPRSVVVDRQDRLWVSDTGYHRLLVFDKDGKLVKAIGARGNKDLQFQEPFGLACDKDGNVYVADRLNFRVQVISPNFTLLRQFKVQAWEASQVNQEPYLAVDSAQGWLWVSDPTKNKVHRYDLKGSSHKVYDKGFDGRAGVAFNLPTGLAVGSDGSVYVSDSGTNRILTLKP